MKQSIVVIGAHPDDCEIGAGGTIALYAQRGHEVHMISLRVPCDCASSCQCPPERSFRDRCRWREASTSAQVLGARLSTLALSREQMRPDAELVGRLDALFDDLRPDAVFTHWLGDSHPEHWETTRAVLAATRRNRCAVYMYEETIPGGISPHAFRAQKFIDITETLEAKLAGVRCHESQVAAFGPSWLEAIRGRAARRGFQIGSRYAEAFQIVKEIGHVPRAEAEAAPEIAAETRPAVASEVPAVSEFPELRSVPMALPVDESMASADSRPSRGDA